MQKLIIILWITAAQIVLATIPRFIKVTDGLYRGGQPAHAKDYELLEKLNIKTIINFRETELEIGAERNWAIEKNIEFIHVPMSPLVSPSDQDILKVESILVNPSYYPLFVHCAAGKDRTGLVFGLYRVWHEHWTAQNAYNEMRKIGFRPFFVALERYFWNHTQPQN